MELTRVSGLDEADNYLRVSELCENLNYTKVAYVMDTDVGVSKTESGYAKFYLKDANATVVTAFLFSVQDFANSGIKLSMMKGKPVLVTFVPQVYHGRVSLIIDGQQGIRVWDGEFEQSIFIGKVEYNEQLIVKSAQAVLADWEFPAEFRIFTDNRLGQGREGAYPRVIEMALRTLAGYTGSVPDGKGLLRVFFALVDANFKLMRLKQKFDFLTDAKVFDVVNEICQKYHDDEFYPVVVDGVRALAGFGKPTHLYSILSLEVMRQAEHVLNLIIVNEGLVTGTSIETGGVVLSKY